MKRIRHLLVTATVLLVGTTAVRAATFNVADGDVAGLIAAIQQANSTSGVDTIILAANGNYTLTQVHNTIRGEGTNGLPIVVDDLTIVGNGAVILRSSARAVPAFRFFYVSGQANLELLNLTLHNGRQNGGGSGGSILAHGNLILTGCVFSSNVATEAQAGAILAFGGLTVDASRFLDNFALGGGGAIAKKSLGTATVSGSTFEHNEGQFGGAIALFAGSGGLTISGSTFVANGALSTGGALHNASTISISNSTFHLNHAASGGGIYNVPDSTLVMVHSTFIDNFSNGGPAGGNIHNSGTLHLRNSLLALSHTAADCVNDGSMPTNVNNLIGDGSCSPMLTGDPKVAPLSNYGGLTETHALLGDSPALDAAATSACTSTDQRGVPRPLGPACDIGAFEGMLLPVYHWVSPMTRPPLFIPLCDPLLDGTITVIVRSERSFDARAVVVDSVAVGNARPSSVTRSRFEDVDQDGDVDAVLEFALTDVYRGLSCQSTTSLAVDGLLRNGERFRGLLLVTPDTR